MSKRYTPVKEFARTTKKPKLDINILESHAASSRAAITSKVNIKTVSTSASSSSNNDLWDDDDDDDVILLATQVAESEAAAEIFRTPTITESEMTYIEFAPNVHATTSTQHLPAVLSAKGMADLFDDDDDIDLEMLAAAAIEVEEKSQLSQMQKPVEVFKKPMPLSLTRRNSNTSKPRNGAAMANSSKTVAITPSKPSTSRITQDQTSSNKESVLSQSQSVGAKRANMFREPQQSGSTNDITSSQSATEARRQLATERQIKFLMERVDALKKDNLKLEKDLGETKSNMVTKEGESSLLRDELRHLRQQVQTLKMQKLLTVEEAKAECKSKISELSREVQTKDAELTLKKAENVLLKMKHADEKHRLEMSMSMYRNESIMEVDDYPEPTTVAATESPNKKSLHTRNLMRLSNLTIESSNGMDLDVRNVCSKNSFLNEFIYESSNERGNRSKQRRTIFEIELEEMQKLLAQRQLSVQQTVEEMLPLCPSYNIEAYVEKVITSVCKVFSEFWTYVHNLEFPKNVRIYPYHEYNIIDDASDRSKQRSLHQPSELYAEERALSLRRYIAALAVIVRRIPRLTARLLSHRHGKYALMQIAIDGISKLGYAREVCEHFGLVESFATLLHSMLSNFFDDEESNNNKHKSSEVVEMEVIADDAPTTSRAAAQRVTVADKFTANPVEQQSAHKTLSSSENCADIETTKTSLELLIELLKNIIFVRPSPWIFCEISFCLLKLRDSSLKALDMLCSNSSCKTFYADRVRSLYRFTNDTCFLQVYAGLLEIAFPLYESLRPRHFELLSVICYNHVQLVFQCFAQPPKFIHNQLPCYESDDELDAGSEELFNEEEPALTKTSSEHNFQYSNSRVDNCSTSVNASGSNSSAAAASTLSQTKDEITCECYAKLCLSVVTLLFQLLRQWQHFDKSKDTSRVVEISQISVQLLHIIFCDNYITQLFHDAEETTKHYLSLICEWWSENIELLEFSDVHKKFLEKLQTSHVMPKTMEQEMNPDNIKKDLTEWYRISNDVPEENEDMSNCDELRLMEDACDPDKYFEGLKGYAFNFECNFEE